MDRRLLGDCPAWTAPLPCETSSQVLQGTQVDNREQAQNVQLDNTPSKVKDLLKQQTKQCFFCFAQIQYYRAMVLGRMGGLIKSALP